ncbi:oligosaccharide flippase family protein [Sphingobium aromaticiconvertens]|uniref:oligosaccharide flippase family protein n=1 Tax=Sphingobium aromaticiconvertens TaxID=365341 RepID=UPI0030172FF5
MVDLASRDTNIVVLFVIVNNLLRAVSSVILTRLLMPEVFGISGILSSIAFTAAMMSDLGFQTFVVRHEDGDKPRFLDTIWTIALLRSATLTLLLILLAQPIATMLGKPELAPLIAGYSVTFMIDGLASLTLLTALRNRMILRLSLLELAVAILQIVVATLLAYLWRNPWAIIGALLASAAFKSLLSYLMFSDSIRRIAFDRTYARDLWRFARFVTGSSIITLLLMQSDKLLFARLMPLDAFGFYILAGNLASGAFAFTSAYASRVLYPTYAQLWREGYADLREQFYAKRRLPSLLYSFCTGGLIGCAPLVIAILYDPRYADAALYLRLLMLMPLFMLASNAANETLVATGRIRATFEANVVKLLWLAVAGPISFVTEGILGLILVFAIMEVPAMVFKWMLMHKIALLDLRQELLFIGTAFGGMVVGAAGDLMLHPLFA